MASPGGWPYLKSRKQAELFLPEMMNWCPLQGSQRPFSAAEEYWKEGILPPQEPYRSPCQFSSLNSFRWQIICCSPVRKWDQGDQVPLGGCFLESFSAAIFITLSFYFNGIFITQKWGVEEITGEKISTANYRTCCTGILWTGTLLCLFPRWS